MQFNKNILPVILLGIYSCGAGRNVYELPVPIRYRVVERIELNLIADSCCSGNKWISDLLYVGASRIEIKNGSQNIRALYTDLDSSRFLQLKETIFLSCQRAKLEYRKW